MVEKHEETWNLFLEEKNNLMLELQSAEKMKNEYYVKKFSIINYKLYKIFNLGMLQEGMLKIRRIFSRNAKAI